MPEPNSNKKASYYMYSITSLKNQNGFKSADMGLTCECRALKIHVFPLFSIYLYVLLEYIGSYSY